MAEYLLYCLANDEFVRCDHFEAESDEEAVAEALRRQDGLAAELWRGARRVKNFAGHER